nr:hypothetical protein L203_02955 [Cryptococcus depauperatus CBS 7841]
MPKPTFLQTVLRKPARSYANTNAPSPWSDTYDQDQDPKYPTSYYSEESPSLGSVSRHMYGDVGTSKRPVRGPSSTVSASAASERSIVTRFPKSARRAASHVILRDGEIVHAPYENEAVSELSSASATKKSSIKKKEKFSPLPAGTYPAKEIRRRPSMKGTLRTRKEKRTASVDDDANSALSSPICATLLSEPVPKLSRLSETSSSALSSPLPASPMVALQPKGVDLAIEMIQSRSAISATTKKSPESLLAQTISSTSTSNSSLHLTSEQRVSIPPVTEHMAILTSNIEGDMETDDEVFYTPRSSFEEQPTPIDIVSESSMASQPQTKSANYPFEAPVLNILPPTPAPVIDPPTSPFRSFSTSPTCSPEVSTPFSHHLHPEERSRLLSIHTYIKPSSKASPRVLVPPNYISPILPKDDLNIQSVFSNVGSDENKNSECFGTRTPDHSSNRLSRKSFTSRPSSRAHTVRSSSGDEGRPRSRNVSIRYVSQSSFEDGSRAASEVSFGSTTGREGSTRGNVGGFGKGGWAAAAASGGSRGGATSPVMYLPTQGNGWENFQPPVRQSKFMPLPFASSPSFDKLVSLKRAGNSFANPSSVSSSQTNPQIPNSHLNSFSSSSEHSQQSEGLFVPSRSYVKNVPNQTRQNNLSCGDVNNYGAERGEAFCGSTQNSEVVPFPVRTTSPLPNSYPQSPIFTRPATPRNGFEPPSFLDPDILTVLPEMSLRDSEKLLHASPEFSQRSSRLSLSNSYNNSRRSSIFKAMSEVGFGAVGSGSSEKIESSGYMPPPPLVSRSKRTDGGQKWEGSSYGDGVLMESHGRDQLGNGGYTNLILPSGSYRPSNPAKSTSDLDARILGLPHATMASITLQTAFDRRHATPEHLRDQLSTLVDFTSHLKPPHKIRKNHLLIQVYAVALDLTDLTALEGKSRGDVGKWVPGRSFVGRVLVIGTDEKELVRGDIVIGITDIRKSGALSEYIVVDRRRVSRAPFPTTLSLEQLSILPLEGIAAARCVHGALNRHSQAIVHDAHIGVAALVCQQMARAGVHVTAVIPGGNGSHDAYMKCLEHGAKGVLMGSPTAVMINMEESGYDFVFDTHGGQRVYDAARRLLREGGKLVSTKRPEATFSHAPPQSASRSSGIKTLRLVFSFKRKDLKQIVFEYISPTASGESEVDIAGMDCRDVMEESCMSIFRPVLDAEQDVVPFEKGQEAFKSQGWREGGTKVVRIIN